MSKKSSEKKIKTLDSEIQSVQMEKFINDFDNAMKKDLKSRFKKVGLIIGPLVLSFFGYLVFKNPIILTLGISVTGISGVVTLSKDSIKDMKSLNPNGNKSNPSIINIEQDKDVDQILQEGIGKAKGEDFYSEKYKSTIERKETYAETEEERKYREALERQRQKQITKDYPNLKIIGNDANYLDKEETMVQVVREINAYTVAYKLPLLEISNSQWDLFFDITYDFFRKKGIENEFYDSMSQVGRFVFAKSLLDKKNKISIYDFVENLYYLENQVIEKQEIAILQQDILSKLPSAKIVNFSDYTTEKRRK